jgi:hypothetical protein
MEPPQKAETDQAIEDEKDRDDQIEKPRHDQDQKARDNGNDRRDMGNGEGHKGSSAGRLGIDSRSVTLSPCLALFHDRRRFWRQWVPHCSKKIIGNDALAVKFFANFSWGTMPLAVNWMALHAGTGM